MDAAYSNNYLTLCSDPPIYLSNNSGPLTYNTFKFN